MGSDIAEPPEDEGDADFEGLLLAANAQGAEVARLANGFRRGFRGGSEYNLKDLLVEIVLSKWFRADVAEGAHPIRRVALHDAGARRLLTPEELARKTESITGIQWGRRIGHTCPYKLCEDARPHALTRDYRLLYGGIDSDGIIDRTRDITSVMAGGGQATRGCGELPGRHAGLLPHARIRAAIVCGHRPVRDAGTGAERHVPDRGWLVCPPGETLPERPVRGGTQDRAIDLRKQLLESTERRPEYSSGSTGLARLVGAISREPRA